MCRMLFEIYASFRSRAGRSHSVNLTGAGLDDRWLQDRHHVKLSVSLERIGMNVQNLVSCL